MQKEWFSAARVVKKLLEIQLLTIIIISVHCSQIHYTEKRDALQVGDFRKILIPICHTAS